MQLAWPDTHSLTQAVLAQNLELLWHIRAALVQQGFLPRRCVHVHPANGEQRAVLEDMAKKMQASTAASPGERRCCWCCELRAEAQQVCVCRRARGDPHRPALWAGRGP